MFEEKLKKELLEKIRELLINLLKRDKIEKEHGLSDDDFGPAWEELLANNEEYFNLTEKGLELHDRIGLMLVDTKYFPILGLSDKQNDILGILLEAKFDVGEKQLEKHLDILFVKLKDEMKERLRKVKPLRLTKHIEPRTHFFYREVITCYIYGAYEASCALCRAITQTMAERFIIGKGYGDLLAGKNRDKKQMSIQEICLKILSLDKALVALYTGIDNKASNILHRKEVATEEDALKMIRNLQEFIIDSPALS